MISNMESQLKQMGCLDKIDKVMEEVPKVRKDMGYIPLVTPTSQIVGTQAVFNVLMGERYKQVPKESRDVFAGRYGKTPVPVDPDIQKKVLNGEQPIECRPADLIQNEFDKIRSEIADLSTSEDDALSYALFPQVWREFWKAKTSPPEPPKEKPAPAPAAAPTAPAAAPSIPRNFYSGGGTPSGLRGGLNPGTRLSLKLVVDGKPYESEVEVLG
jgi:oxaloacetate decarboxylase alpha subunit